jgi:hypothetical protein
MRIIISQPRYLPVPCYLSRLLHSDLFVILDDVQRQYLGVENRNKILTAKGPRWLSVPISSSRKAMIQDAEISGNAWVADHYNSIASHYKNAPCFNQEWLDSLFGVLREIGPDGAPYADVIVEYLKALCGFFGFTPNIVRSSTLDIDHEETGPAHLYSIAEAVGASHYISGANGIHYGIDAVFPEEMLLFHHYEPLAYPQFNAEAFVPWMCFWDMLFNVGYEETVRHINEPLALKCLNGDAFDADA